MFGHRLIEDARRVGAEEACLRGFAVIDAVVSDAEACDDATRLQGVVQRSGVRARPDDNVRSVRFPYGWREIVFSVRRAQALQAWRRQETVFRFPVFRLGDEDFRPRIRHVAGM
jgi:hypothetical protein